MPDPIRLRTRARIGAHVLWDHLARPPATSIDEVPCGVEGLTPEWLTAVLCRDVPGAEVLDVQVTGGHDGSSIRRGLSLTYNDAGRDAGLPTSLFTKATPTLLTRLMSGFAAEAEAAFYTQIRPELGVEAPTHHHSAVDTESMLAIHIFDDLVSTRGASFCNQETFATREQAEQIVDTLAELHSTFYDSPRLDTELSWLSTFEDFVRINERNGFREGHDRAMVEAADVIPDRLLDRKEEIWPRLMESLGLHHREPETLLHSDVHIGNWYVTAEGRMGIGDWATICRGLWARDVAYALSTAMDPTDRREWERDLLLRYVDTMTERSSLRISFDDAWDRYRAHLFAALFMWTPTLCHPPTTPEMQPPEMSREMIRRITVAIDDLEALDCKIGA